ncbi:intercellular adhesion molecule 5-like isoform X2 [Mixophyes fleayi]
MDVKLEIKGNTTLTDCSTTKGNSPNITCKLEVTKDMHEMEFTCEAQFKTQSKPQKMYIQTEPKFTDCPDKVVWIDGKENSFLCKASGYPPPTVTCSKEGKEYAALQKFTTSKAMAGKYNCAAENFDMISKTVAVSVEYKPEKLKINVNPSLHNEGDNVTISCEADGNPTPTYSWSMPSSSIELSHDNRSIEIWNMKKSHLGKYICTAQNQHGTATLEEKIALKVKPIISKIIVKPSAQLTEGDNVTLTCEANGFPPPTYSWQKPTPNAVFSKDKKTINIQKAQKTHGGNYICTAQNEHGSDTMTQTITVKEPERKPNGVERTEPAITTVIILMSTSFIYYLC